MKLVELSIADIRWHLSGPGLTYRIGPFVVRLNSPLSDLPYLLSRLYGDYSVIEGKEFADFHVALVLSRDWRRWWRPQVQFKIDGEDPFSPFPRDTALPFLEWGLNWCVYTRAHHYLMLHAGVVEKDGHTLLLPAYPGSGKSTLCAALMNRGWRLLSDEFGLVRPADLAIVPFPRLIPLKNESIGVIRTFVPEAVMGPEYPKTRKGTVAHLRPSRASIECSDELGRVRWIVFPKYSKDTQTDLQSVSKTQAFLKLTSGHSFNYEQIGLRGFEAMAGLVDSSDCYTLEYGSLEQAIIQLNALAAGRV